MRVIARTEDAGQVLKFLEDDIVDEKGDHEKYEQQANTIREIMFGKHGPSAGMLDLAAHIVEQIADDEARHARNLELVRTAVLHS